MSKPIIMTIDDEPQVLNAIERDLRKHFGAEYRIIKAGSGPMPWRLFVNSKAAIHPLLYSWLTSGCPL